MPRPAPATAESAAADRSIDKFRGCCANRSCRFRPCRLLPTSARRSRAIRLAITSLSAAAERDVFGRRRDLALDILHHVDQHLGRAQIGIGGLVDEMGDHRLALGDPPAPAVVGDDRRLVERGDQQCLEVFRAGAARIAGLALLEPAVQRRLAVADLVIALRLGHLPSVIPRSRTADRCARRNSPPPVGIGGSSVYITLLAILSITYFTK